MVSVPISDGSGLLDRYTDFVFPADEQRTVDVWCPPGYADATDVRYPVLYMHDGQNLFDPALAYGGVDWGIDEAVLRLMQQHGHPSVLIVGIWNSGEARWLDYSRSGRRSCLRSRQRSTSGAGRPARWCAPTATCSSSWRS